MSRLVLRSVGLGLALVLVVATRASATILLANGGVDLGDGTTGVVGGGISFLGEDDARANYGLTSESAYDSYYNSDYDPSFVAGPDSCLGIPLDDGLRTMLSTIVLNGGLAQGPWSYHQAVPAGYAYKVTLFFLEDYQDYNRSQDISGDITATGVNSELYANWSAVQLTTGIEHDGSIDFTITGTQDNASICGFAWEQVASIPEPSTLALLAAGLAGLLCCAWRKGR